MRLAISGASGAAPTRLTMKASSFTISRLRDASSPAVYASRRALPHAMQDSLPAGGLRLCRAGSRTRWIATRGFRSCHPPLQGLPWRNNRSVSPWHRPAGRRVRCAQMTDLGAVRPFTTSARPGHHGLTERLRRTRTWCPNRSDCGPESPTLPTRHRLLPCVTRYIRRRSEPTDVRRGLLPPQQDTPLHTPQTIPPLLQQTSLNPIRATFPPDYGLAFAQILPTNSRASCSSESTSKSRSSKTLSTNPGP